MVSLDSLPFVRPATYYGEREPPLGLGPAVVAVLCVALVVTASFAAMGWLFVTNLPEDATVENPDRPPEQFCEDAEPGDPFYDDCHPERVPMDEVLREEVRSQLPLVFVATVGFWLVVALAVHLTAAVAGDPAGGFGDSLTVAGWAMGPAAVHALAGVAAVRWWLRDRTLSGDPALLQSQLETLLAVVDGPCFVAVTTLIVAWQTYVLYCGLHDGRELSANAAGFAAGLVGILLLVVQLA